MAKHTKPKIKMMDARANPTDNQVKAKEIATNLKDDSNQAVQDAGDLVDTAADNMTAAIQEQQAAIDVKEASTANLHTVNSESCKTVNDAAIVVMTQHPNDSTLWKKFGFSVTEEIISDRPLPGKVKNGGMSQGDFLKTFDIQFDPVEYADNYTVEYTKGDPLDASKYIAAKGKITVLSRTSATFDAAEGYTGVVLWVKVTAHNTKGSGPASDPFGGMIIQ